MKLFLQDMKHLARKNCKIRSFLARFLQDFLYLARKASILVRDLASLARKILARFGYFLQDGF